MSKSVVGHCPKCGAPIYVPTAWWGVGAPPNEYTCACVPQPHVIITNTTDGDTPAKADKLREALRKVPLRHSQLCEYFTLGLGCDCGMTAWQERVRVLLDE